MKFIAKVLIVLALTQTEGFSASRLTLFEPALMHGMRRATSLLSVSVARSTPSLLRPDISPDFSSDFRYIQAPTSACFSALLKTSKRLLSQDSRIPRASTIYHPCIDGIFQYGFDGPVAITSFLNAVLDLKGEREIQSVEHIKRDMPPADPASPLGYHFTVDVRCRTKDGQHFLVEMQNDFRDDYHLKSLIEYARMLSRLDTDQTEEDKQKRAEKNKQDATKFWKGIQGIYAVVITNKSFPADRMKSFYSDEPLMEPLLVNPYELRHMKQADRHYGDVPNQIVLLMLDNLTKSVDQLSSPLERWAYVFKDIALKSGVRKIPETKEIEDIDLIAGVEPGILEFIERIDVKNLPAEVRDRYMRAIHYYNTTIVDIEDKAIEKGKTEEFEKNVRSMRKKGLSAEQIADFLEAPIEKVSEVPIQ